MKLNAIQKQKLYARLVGDGRGQGSKARKRLFDIKRSRPEFPSHIRPFLATKIGFKAYSKEVES